MAQFDVYKNRNAASSKAFPLLVDVQSPLLNELTTRVAIPLSAASATAVIDTLKPLVKLDGVPYLLVTSELAAISLRSLTTRVGNLEAHRFEIIAAIDFLLSGI
jgi:toxin CcdB